VVGVLSVVGLLYLREAVSLYFRFCKKYPLLAILPSPEFLEKWERNTNKLKICTLKWVFWHKI
jgi:hypothetical protein